MISGAASTALLTGSSGTTSLSLGVRANNHIPNAISAARTIPESEAIITIGSFKSALISLKNVLCDSAVLSKLAFCNSAYN